MLPQIAEFGHLRAWHIVCHRHAGQFDNATLDRIHQREVTHRPGKQGALCIARALQKEGCCREVIDLLHSQFTFYGLNPRDPQTSFFIVFLRFFLVIALEIVQVVIVWFLAIAVVGFVVDDQDVFHSHQLRHHPLDHLPFGFERLEFRSTSLN